MKHKYILLKSSWGIVIFIEMEELLDFQINNSDIEVFKNIYLRVEETQKLKRDTIIYWVARGIRDLAEQIQSIVKSPKVCYTVKSVDFNYSDFQEEGLYFATQEWISKYYDIKIAPAEVLFDKEKNKYIFPDLS